MDHDEKISVYDSFEGDGPHSVNSLKAQGFRIFDTVIATDDAGIFYILIIAKDGQKHWLPLRTD
jgi:hypothetical protein